MDTIIHPPRLVGLHKISDWEPIAGDASGRRYWRVVLAQGGTAVLCRYPDSWRSLVKRDLEVLIWLRDRGLPVPKILAGDALSVWVLLEDLGPVDGEQALMATPPASRVERAAAFVDPLIRLAAVPVEHLPAWNPCFDQAFLRWELAGFEMWCHRGKAGRDTRGALGPWLDELATVVARHPRMVCFRDFHLNNILVNTDGRVGIIDVQDLRRGPDTYDLASLLSDRAMPNLLTLDERHAIAGRWAEGVGATSGWERRLEETTLQRTLKVLGTFEFLSAKGLSSYRRWIPKTASAATEIARKFDAPSEAIAILLDLEATGGF